MPALTEKDIKDALFAIELDVDWIALSFVRTAEDLNKINDLVKENSDHKIPIIALRFLDCDPYTRAEREGDCRQ